MIVRNCFCEFGFAPWQSELLRCCFPPVFGAGHAVEFRGFCQIVNIRDAKEVLFSADPEGSDVMYGAGLVILLLAGVLSGGMCSAGDDTGDGIAHGRRVYTIQSDTVELAVTAVGGHQAPVTFFPQSDAPIRPYYISPWQDEPASEMPVPVLVPLRGDFFCMPFGGNGNSYHGEMHPPHGEVAGSRWQLEGKSHKDGVQRLDLSLATQVRSGRVLKSILLRDGESVIYTTHRISGFSGATSLGHHATLAMPDEEGSVRIATSAIQFGMTCPGIFSNPLNKEYQRLLPGARWESLAKVPLAWKGTDDADLTRMPGTQGFADLVQIFPKQPPAGEPAWVTATFAERGFLWFSMKDPGILKSTVFWMENRGRHGHPWNGRNNCLGLEDVTAFFAEGLSDSASDNVLRKAGIATSVTLSEQQPFHVHYIQGVVRIPEGFDVVQNVTFGDGSATFHSQSGAAVSTEVRFGYVFTGTF